MPIAFGRETFGEGSATNISLRKKANAHSTLASIVRVGHSLVAMHKFVALGHQFGDKKNSKATFNIAALMYVRIIFHLTPWNIRATSVNKRMNITLALGYDGAAACGPANRFLLTYTNTIDANYGCGIASELRLTGGDPERYMCTGVFGTAMSKLASPVSSTIRDDERSRRVSKTDRHHVMRTHAHVSSSREAFVHDERGLEPRGSRIKGFASTIHHSGLYNASITDTNQTGQDMQQRRRQWDTNKAGGQLMDYTQRQTEGRRHNGW
ncbi:hypothetical protein CBL_03261 [Carabus blaptoides fortunei]